MTDSYLKSTEHTAILLFIMIDMDEVFALQNAHRVRTVQSLYSELTYIRKSSGLNSFCDHTYNKQEIEISIQMNEIKFF